MRFGLACLLLVCLIGMAVSAYRNRDQESKDDRALITSAGVAAGIAGIDLGRRIRWGRWGRWGWGKKRFSLRSSARETLAEVFNTLDEDGDGFIVMDELKDDFGTVLKEHTKELKDPESLMSQSDKNEDGRIDFDEFMKELGPSNGGA